MMLATNSTLISLPSKKINKTTDLKNLVIFFLVYRL